VFDHTDGIATMRTALCQAGTAAMNSRSLWGLTLEPSWDASFIFVLSGGDVLHSYNKTCRESLYCAITRYGWRNTLRCCATRCH